MRKLILGIIAVICLDIAFIVYPGSNQPAERVSVTINDDSRRINSIASSGTEEKTASTPIDDATADSGSALAANGTERVPAVISRSTVAGRKRADTGPQQLAESVKLNALKRVESRRGSDSHAGIKPTIITVTTANSAEPLDRRRDSSERLKKEGTDERSLIASVLPIVKKPYEWLKFLSSKLR